MTEAGNEYVILGNDALMKCEVPSFVSDLVQVHNWIDNENNEFYLKDGFISKRGGPFLLGLQVILNESGGKFCQ